MKYIVDPTTRQIKISDWRERSPLFGKNDLFVIDGEELPREKVQISYSILVSHSSFPDARQLWLPVTEEEIETYHQFVLKEYDAFCAACPDDKDDESLFGDWLEDAFAESDFNVELDSVSNPVPAYIVALDFFQPKVEKIE